MAEFYEAYRKLNDPGDTFDIDFWQKQGPEAIFDAVYDLIMEAQMLKEGHAEAPRLQRTVEKFQRI